MAGVQTAEAGVVGDEITKDTGPTHIGQSGAQLVSRGGM